MLLMLLYFIDKYDKNIDIMFDCFKRAYGQLSTIILYCSILLFNTKVTGLHRQIYAIHNLILLKIIYQNSINTQYGLIQMKYPKLKIN